MKRLAFSLAAYLLVSALAILPGCARKRAASQELPQERERLRLSILPSHFEGTPAERYRVAYVLWATDLDTLLSRIPGDEHMVELAFTRLRDDLALMRSLLTGDAGGKAAALLEKLDALKPMILRARNNAYVEHRLRPIDIEVRKQLSPGKVETLEGGS